MGNRAVQPSNRRELATTCVGVRLIRCLLRGRWYLGLRGSLACWRLLHSEVVQFTLETLDINSEVVIVLSHGVVLLHHGIILSLDNPNDIRHTLVLRNCCN